MIAAGWWIWLLRCEARVATLDCDCSCMYLVQRGVPLFLLASVFGVIAGRMASRWWYLSLGFALLCLYCMFGILGKVPWIRQDGTLIF
jgi:hypothetical protein